MKPVARAYCAGFVALALALAPGPASARAPGPALLAPAARGETVIVLPITVRGPLEQHIPRALESRLASGLRRAGFTTVIEADAVRGRVPAGECAAACLQELARADGADYLVRAEVTVEGRDYDVRVTLLRASTGEAAVKGDELCEICGHEELGDRVDDLASKLRRKLGALAPPPPRLRVLTRPAGSVVKIDGASVGVTPLDIVVTAGDREVVIERDGFVPHRRQVKFAVGTTETIADELARVPAPVVPGPAKPRLAPFGWAAMAVGVGALAGGIALIAVDERPIRRDCAGANVDADGDCKYRRATLEGGVALAVAGVAAIAVGVALAVIDRRRSKRAPERATVRALGTGLLVRF